MSHVNWALALVGGGEDCDMMYGRGVILILGRYGGVVEIEVDINTPKRLVREYYVKGLLSSSSYDVLVPYYFNSNRSSIHKLSILLALLLNMIPECRNHTFHTQGSRRGL